MLWMRNEHSVHALLASASRWLLSVEVSGAQLSHAQLQVLAVAAGTPGSLTHWVHQSAQATGHQPPAATHYRTARHATSCTQRQPSRHGSWQSPAIVLSHCSSSSGTVDTDGIAEPANGQSHCDMMVRRWTAECV